MESVLAEAELLVVVVDVVVGVRVITVEFSSSSILASLSLPTARGGVGYTGSVPDGGRIGVDDLIVEFGWART